MFVECSIVKLEQCNHLLLQKDMKTQQTVSPITWIIRSDVNKQQQVDVIMTTSTQQRHIQ